MAERPAEWVRREREATGWTREELATISGVSEATVKRIEAGNEAVAYGLVVAVIESLQGGLVISGRIKHAVEN